jgi:hypothetical protein
MGLPTNFLHILARKRPFYLLRACLKNVHHRLDNRLLLIGWKSLCACSVLYLLEQFKKRKLMDVFLCPFHEELLLAALEKRQVCSCVNVFLKRNEQDHYGRENVCAGTIRCIQGFHCCSLA